MYQVPPQQTAAISRARLLGKLAIYWIIGGLVLGALGGALFGMLLSLGSGDSLGIALFGGYFGGLMGLPIGVMNWIVLSILVQGWFYPAREGVRWATRIAAGVLTPLGVVGWWAAINLLPGDDAEAAFFIGVPALIAMATALFLNERFLKWYMRR